MSPLTSWDFPLYSAVDLMNLKIFLKLISSIVLLALLIVTICGIYKSADAMQSYIFPPQNQASHAEIAAPHNCPCTPQEQHSDYDGCDTCINCACHAPITVDLFKLAYTPSICSLTFPDPFQSLPEVYLSKFIPPQEQA